MDSGNTGKTKSKEHDTVSRPPGFHPPNSNTEIKHHRAYPFHQLLNIRDLATVQEFSGSLPPEIDRKKLSGLARKRRYPFVSDPRYRKGNGSTSSSQSSSQNRWNEKNGGAQWRNKQKNQSSSVVRSDPKPSTEQNEEEIHEDTIEPQEENEKGDDEVVPLWAQDDDNEIKSKPFVFKLLDREKDRENFAQQGNVPSEPSFVSREKLEKKEAQEKKKKQQEEAQESVEEVKEFGDASNISELFRAAGSQGDSLPQMPQSAIAHDILEKKTVANTALQETRFANNKQYWNEGEYHHKPNGEFKMGDYSQFAFGSDRIDNRGQPKKSNREQQQREQLQQQGAGTHPQDDGLVYRGRLPPSSQQQKSSTTGGGHVTMPPPNEPGSGSGRDSNHMTNVEMEKYLRERNLHDRRDVHHDPRMPRDYEDFVSKDRSRQGTQQRSVSPNPINNYPPQRGGGPNERGVGGVGGNNKSSGSGGGNQAGGPSSATSGGKYDTATFTSSQKLDTILFEITVPVRPCIGGRFFAPARPLSNKELYDFSPKYREIHDKIIQQKKSRQRQKESFLAINLSRAKVQELERRRNEQKHYHTAKHFHEKHFHEPRSYGRSGMPPNRERERGVVPDYHRPKPEHDYGHMVKQRRHQYNHHG